MQKTKGEQKYNFDTMHFHDIPAKIKSDIIVPVQNQLALQVSHTAFFFIIIFSIYGVTLKNKEFPIKFNTLFPFSLVHFLQS